MAVRRAFNRPLNRAQHHQTAAGPEYLFAKGIATGLLPPPRDLEALHDNSSAAASRGRSAGRST
jgi:hypothetical protein